VELAVCRLVLAHPRRRCVARQLEDGLVAERSGRPQGVARVGHALDAAVAVLNLEQVLDPIGLRSLEDQLPAAPTAAERELARGVELVDERDPPEPPVADGAANHLCGHGRQSSHPSAHRARR
jgi:hypothetical protein